ncbi:unnamed protein product [Clonostachys byssicola]|uniref:Uncharacterized protein n=1 Tax=Clonostachys byssicola TaxID=160290 RepID=A0A9N9XVU7_9HYPO|nr:unnamed protein product [Clonostachys byssicola]
MDKSGYYMITCQIQNRTQGVKSKFQKSLEEIFMAMIGSINRRGPIASLNINSHPQQCPYNKSVPRF